MMVFAILPATSTKSSLWSRLLHHLAEQGGGGAVFYNDGDVFADMVAGGGEDARLVLGGAAHKIILRTF